MTLHDLQRYFDRQQPVPAGQEYKPGVLFGAPEAQYRAFRGVNASLIKHATAAEMWHSLHEPSADHFATEVQAIKWTAGILAHWAVLEPWRFQDMAAHIVTSPTAGLATKRAQAVREAYPDKLVVTPDLLILAAQCRAAIEAHPLAVQLLRAPGGNEVTLSHYEPELGYWRKGRFDRVPMEGNFLLDVKTTAFPLPQFPREIRKFGYHIQAAWYLDLWEAVTGERREKFIWVAVTKSAPFMCRLFEVDNWPVNHVLYRDSPLKAAREMIDARLGSFVTSLNETIQAMKAGLELDEGLTRSLWTAYEHMPITPITGSF